MRSRSHSGLSRAKLAPPSLVGDAARCSVTLRPTVSMFAATSRQSSLATGLKDPAWQAAGVRKCHYGDKLSFTSQFENRRTRSPPPCRGPCEQFAVPASGFSGVFRMKRAFRARHAFPVDCHSMPTHPHSPTATAGVARRRPGGPPLVGVPAARLSRAPYWGLAGSVLRFTHWARCTPFRQRAPPGPFVARRVRHSPPPSAPGRESRSLTPPPALVAAERLEWCGHAASCARIYTLYFFAAPPILPATPLYNITK